jgi:hypothetical protein
MDGTADHRSLPRRCCAAIFDKGCDGVYGRHFRNRVEGMGIQEVLTAAQSPWQNPFVERLIGSIRRECFDHIIVLGEGLEVDF